jgi:bifunctional DNA-binding transcriptional regulator/antitoxin component of YhaV-PrlF toxin-antitoxin module
MATATKPFPAQSFRAKVTSKGVVTLPVELRRSAGLNPGDTVCFELPQDHNNRPVHSVNMRICKKSSGTAPDSSMQHQGKEVNRSE